MKKGMLVFRTIFRQAEERCTKESIHLTGKNDLL
jgi:hypothetical protein